MTESQHTSHMQFKVGRWSADLTARKIVIDKRIVQFLQLHTHEFTLDELLQLVHSPEQQLQLASAWDELPQRSSLERCFAIRWLDRSYTVELSVDEEESDHRRSCGFVRVAPSPEGVYLSSQERMAQEMELDMANRQVAILTEQRRIASKYLRSAIVYVDLNYTVQWSTMSDNISAYLRGYKPGEKCYKSAFNRDAPCEVCSLRAIQETLKPYTHEYESEGRVWEISAFPSLAPNGSLQGVILRQEDVTNRKKNERKILELNHLMEAILNNIPIYLFVKNPNDDFRYLYWNKAFAEHSHIPSHLAVGRTDSEIFPSADDVEHFRQDDLRLLEGQKNIEFEEEYITAMGEKRYVRTMKMLIHTEQKLPWLMGLSWDITEVKRFQSELIKARLEAEENDRFKSQFVANMSHEIRTPLNAIVGFSELLLDDSLEQEERQEYVSIIQKNNNLLLQLISDILDLSKIEARMLEFHYDNVDINALCTRIATASRLRNDVKVPILFDEPQQTYLVRCDENRVQQVITNLVTNAIKFTHHGNIRIHVQPLPTQELEISVEDTGDGIPEEKINLVFNRFVKLNSHAQGTGLGLSICKNLVEQFGGRIGVSSKLGHGTRFWFTLPMK